ncbi:MAG: hypothetical protein ACXVHB_26120 [Solirubrobacteraceae bacterium]
MRLIATTDEHGLHVDREQLERAEIKAGSRPLVEIRPYTEEGRAPDGKHTFSSGGKFLPYLGACPSHRDVGVDRPVAGGERIGVMSRVAGFQAADRLLYGDPRMRPERPSRNTGARTEGPERELSQRLRLGSEGSGDRGATDTGSYL